jgi:CheY-like chemotaxis protein
MKEQLYHNSGRWLVVDDDPSVLALTCAILTRLTGVRPERFADGAEALAAVQSDPETVEMVITDLDMPRMTGTELCGKLLRLRPSLSVILATGSGFISQGTAAGFGFSALLKKPFCLSDLAAALALVTDKTADNLETATVAEGTSRTTSLSDTTKVNNL